MADDLVVATGQGRERCYSLNESSSALGPIEQLARACISPRKVLQIVGRANPAVEFVGLSKDHTIAVFAKRSSPSDRSRALDYIREAARALGSQTRFFDHAELRTPGVNAAALRRAVAGGEVLVGSVDRSIPDRSGRRQTAGRPLGRVNPSLQLPSPRTLRLIKHRHGVRTLRIFGSAVRTDFGRDSDVDVAVVLDPAMPLDDSVIESLESELQSRLGRDVEVVVETQLTPGVRYLLAREAVAL